MGTRSPASASSPATKRNYSLRPKLNIMSPTRPDQRANAVLTICTAGLVTTAQDTTIKWLSGSYPFHEMQTIRCGVALLCVTLFAWHQGGFGFLAVPHLPLVILRGLLLAVASMLFYLAAAAMPYPEAVAMYFTMPLLVALLAGPFLGERVPLFRWLAVAAGFAGVVIILRPGSAVFEPAALVALAAAVCYAFGNLMTRPLSSRIEAVPLAVWQNAMYVAVALVLSARFGTGSRHTTAHVSLDYLTRGWIWPTLFDFLLIAVLGASTGLLMVLYTLSYRLAESSYVAPFEYSAMFWAVLFSFFIWHQWPDVTALLGIGLIVGSGLFLAIRDR
jgi:drug/metabolite transporter (DMT)-like permease